MSRSVVLSTSQRNELELVLAGAWGAGPRYEGPDRPAARLVLPDGESAEPGSTIDLVDEEGTAVASLEVEGTDAVGHAIGAVRPGRPFGHRDQRELRATVATARRARAVVVTGEVPPVDDERWHDAVADAAVVVVDRGDTAALARAVSSARQTGRDVVVLPAPDETARTAHEWVDALRHVARTLVADDVTIWTTPRAQGDGLVLLLTGLSGSGKSTIAKRLFERLPGADARTATLLDGDEVRQILSSGLGFSREDREMNVRRIGWVAALVARHGGIAVCAPIAPYVGMRAEMRERIEAVGRFVLVHISTPLEVCEQRDRKGLYAKARRGEIPQFTGISDPYEEPEDADLTIDASVVPPDEAVNRILEVIASTP
ncbi:adenylyl-sulfate kinase [Microbacter sp. GSS18]|nr:adenylyl-sulfate kinase [Microbacter sp. GSS18]